MNYIVQGRDVSSRLCVEEIVFSVSTTSIGSRQLRQGCSKGGDACTVTLAEIGSDLQPLLYQTQYTISVSMTALAIQLRVLTRRHW